MSAMHLITCLEQFHMSEVVENLIEQGKEDCYSKGNVKDACEHGAQGVLIKMRAMK